MKSVKVVVFLTDDTTVTFETTCGSPSRSDDGFLGWGSASKWYSFSANKVVRFTVEKV